MDFNYYVAIFEDFCRWSRLSIWRQSTRWAVLAGIRAYFQIPTSVWNRTWWHEMQVLKVKQNKTIKHQNKTKTLQPKQNSKPTNPNSNKSFKCLLSVYRICPVSWTLGRTSIYCNKINIFCVEYDAAVWVLWVHRVGRQWGVVVMVLFVQTRIGHSGGGCTGPALELALEGLESCSPTEGDALF